MSIHDVEHCDCHETHKDLIEKVTSHMPDEDELYDLAELFKVFGDSTRIRMLSVLMGDEMCVCDLAEVLSMNQSAISHQLKILRENKILKSRKEGKTVYYSPVYEIGYSGQLYRREWRIAPIIGHYTTVKLDFIIPESVRLHIQSIKIKHNYGYRERDIGIRYHGHGGFVNALGMQLTAEAGFTSCITVPKFTKDGVGVCVHDDTVRTELTLNDGRRIEEGSLLDKNVWDFTYDELMQFCASWRSRSNIFADIRVPTMEEYFTICSPECCCIFIKRSSNSSLGTIFSTCNCSKARLSKLILSK